MGSDRDVAEKLPVVPPHGHLERVGKSLTIAFTAQDVLSTGSTGHYVADCTREFDSQWSGHADNPPEQTVLYNPEKEKIDLTT